MCDSANDILVWWPRNETGCAVYVTRRALARLLAGSSSRVWRRGNGSAAPLPVHANISRAFSPRRASSVYYSHRIHAVYIIIFFLRNFVRLSIFLLFFFDYDSRHHTLSQLHNEIHLLYSVLHTTIDTHIKYKCII